MTTDELIAAAKGLVKELQGRINGGGMDLHGNADSIRRPSVTRLRRKSRRRQMLADVADLERSTALINANMNAIRATDHGMQPERRLLAI